MRHAAMLLLLAAPLAAQEPAPPPPPEKKDARAEIEQVLASRKVTLNFPDTPVEEVVAFLQDLTGLNVVLDPRVDLQAVVNLQVRDLGLGKALGLICEGAGLKHRVWCDVLYLAPKDATLPDPPALPEGDGAAKKVREQRMTLNFDQTPLKDALSFVRDVTGLDALVTSEASKLARDATVTLRLRNVPLASALSLALVPHGLTWGLKDGALVVEPRKADAPAPKGGLTEAELKAALDRVITVNVSAVTIHEAAAKIGQLANVPVEVGPDVPRDEPTSLSFPDVKAREAFDLLCRTTGRRWAIEGGKVVIR